jgi:hypothetical protein
MPEGEDVSLEVAEFRTAFTEIHKTAMPENPLGLPRENVSAELPLSPDPIPA